MSNIQKFSKNDPDIRSSYIREKEFFMKFVTTNHLKSQWAKTLWRFEIAFMYLMLFAESVALLLEYYVKMPFYIEEPIEFFGTFYYFITHVMLFVKYWGIRWNWKHLLELETIMDQPLYHLQNVVPDEDMLRFHRIQDFVGNFVRGACMLSVCTYASTPFFEPDMIGTNKLPVPGTFLIEKDFWWAAYTVQIIAIIYGALTNATSDAMSICLMRILSKRIDIFKLELALLRKQSEEENVAWVKEKVQVHNEILRAVNTTERTLRLTTLAQFINSVVVISCTGLQMMVVPMCSGYFFSLVAYLTAMLTQLVVYNWYGNEVYLKSAEIGTAIYMSEWYECSPKVRKYLFVMMERAKRPSQITVGKLIILYVPTLGRVLQSSYSYLLALKQMMIRNS